MSHHQSDTSVPGKLMHGRREVVLPSYARAVERTQELQDLLDPVKVQARLEARVAAMEAVQGRLAGMVEALGSSIQLLIQQGAMAQKSSKKKKKHKKHPPAAA